MCIRTRRGACLVIIRVDIAAGTIDRTVDQRRATRRVTVAVWTPSVFVLFF